MSMKYFNTPGIRVGLIPTTEKMLYLTGFGFNQLTQLAFVEPESTTLVAMVHLQITHFIRRQYLAVALRTVHAAGVAVGDHENQFANL
jgi:hypothetical protein